MVKRNIFAWMLVWGGMGMSSVACAQSMPVLNALGLLAATDGHTLYTYDADTTPGQSECGGPCLALWPAYAAAASASAPSDFSVIVRADGSRQWAYRGRPLYRYAADQKPGDALGDGMNGTWHTLR